MLSEPQTRIIRKLLDNLEGSVLAGNALEGNVGPRLADPQRPTRTVGLAEIRHARSRLSYGDYGVCEKCNLIIPAAQLMSDPVRRKCTACAERKRPREAGAGPGGMVRRPSGWARA